MLEPFRPTLESDIETLRKVYFLWGEANDYDELSSHNTPIEEVKHKIVTLADTGQFYTAQYREEPVAVMGMYSKYRYVGHIDAIAVDRNFRGKGLGKLALKELVNIAESDDLHLLKVLAKPSVIPFYEKQGFYVDPKDKCTDYPLMLKKLK